MSVVAKYLLGVGGAPTSGGELWSWGDNTHGGLGLGDVTHRSSPVQVGSDTDWLTTAGGRYHQIFLKTDGTIWTVGRNDEGQLGVGDTTDRSSPVQVGTDTDWAIAEANGFGCFGTKTDGTLWSWGLGSYGAHGQGHTSNISSPAQIGALTDWDPDDVEANWNTGQSSGDVRIKSDGTAWGWGYNRWGKNGTGDITHYSSPIQLGSGDTDWAKVRNGNNSTAIIKSDNTLWRCGYNNWGEMGHGDQTHKSSPVQVAGAYDDVAIGDSHMVALKTDGTLWACGWNYAGTIGQGNTTNYSTLQQIGSDTDWDRISVIGYSGTIAVKTNGQVYYAGKNEEGQAGNGAATNLSTLIAVGVADEWEVTNQRYRTFSRGRSWIKA